MYRRSMGHLHYILVGEIRIRAKAFLFKMILIILAIVKLLRQEIMVNMDRFNTHYDNDWAEAVALHIEQNFLGRPAFETSNYAPYVSPIGIYKLMWSFALEPAKNFAFAEIIQRRILDSIVNIYDGM